MKKNITWGTRLEGKSGSWAPALQMKKDAGLSPRGTRGVPGKGNRDSEDVPQKPGQSPALRAAPDKTESEERFYFRFSLTARRKQIPPQRSG